MQNTKILLLLLSLSAFSIADEFDKYRGLCYIYGKYSFFDLRPLERTDQDYILSRTTYADQNETIPHQEFLYVFNFCQPAERSCNDAETDTVDIQRVWGYVEGEDMQTGETICKDYSSYDLAESYESEVIYDEETGVKHVMITYQNGSMCEGNPDLDFYLQIEIQCNPEAEEPRAIGIIPDQCHQKLLYESKHGCPVFSFSAYIVYISEHPLLAAIILIVIGGFTCFKGKKFFDVVCGVIGFLAGFTVSMLFFSAYGMVDYLDPFAAEDGTVGMAILSFVLATLIGLIVGAIMYFFALAIGLFMLSAIVGLFVGVTIYNTFFNYLENEYVLLSCAIGCAIIFVFLAWFMHDLILLVATSFSGAYIFVRGWSMIFGGYPSEYEMYEAYKNDIEMEFEYTFYVYLGAMLLCFVFGMWYQSRDQEEKDEDKSNYHKMEN